MAGSQSDLTAAALRAAAWQGDLAAVSALVEHRVDLNVWDQWGRTALSQAAEAGHLDVVRALLDAGAWVDPHDDYDTCETPLIAAARSGHLDIVRLLCAAGADPTRHGFISQQTAESFARVAGHREVAAYLCLMEIEWRKKNELPRP